MKPFLPLALLCSTTLLLTACSKDAESGSMGATGPAGPSLTGNLTGFVSLYDQYGAHILTMNDSIPVVLGDSAMVSYTDANGKYLFSGLQTGIYNIACAKSGFGSEEVNSLQFTGGGDLYRDIRLSAIPAFNVDSLTVTSNAGGLTVTGHIASDVQQRTILLFAGSTSGTSADPNAYLAVYNKAVMANQNNFIVQVPQGDLLAAGLTTGNTVYFAAYGATPNYNNASSYEDLGTGRMIYTAISSTPALGSGLVP